MRLAIDNEMQQFIDEKLRAGRYASAEDVVRAALAALRQQEFLGDFASGELESLLAEGEQSISSEGTLDADEAMLARRHRRSTRGADHP